MSVQFILGRSGTGKTRYCINAIVEELLDGSQNQPLILLVPEQATYQAERAVLSDPRIAGFNRFKILSFQRLQYQLFGGGADKPTVSQIGREMIIQRILRQNLSRFKLLYRSAERAGLAARLAQTISELLSYAKSPDDIDQLLTTLQKEKDVGLTALKFADIGLVFKEYLEFIEGRFVDSDMQLNLICRALGDAGFVKNGRLWVDGFSGFNASEYAVLAELLRAADESKIAICMDPSEIDLQRPQIDQKAAMSLFYPTLRTYVELAEIIKKAKLKTAPPVILSNQQRFSDSRPLAHIEANIFGQSSSVTSAEEKIRIVSAPNRRAEVEFTASQILELVRKKKFRYRDIAVIAPDIETYQHYIRAYFEDYRIPFFIDRPRPLCRHPVIQLICSAVSAATAGFSNSDIFAYLKTDLTDIGRGDVDLLANYCIAYGICPDDWTIQTEWNFAAPGDIQFDQKHINLIRRKASGDLLELRDRLCCAETEQKILTVEDFTRIIFDFLDKLKISEKLSQWIQQAQSERDYETAELHRQFYDRLLEVFDEFIEVFAGRLLTAADYYSIIRSAFSQLQLALIPPTLDQVLVGSIERSRHPDLKAVFLLGATANQFPAPLIGGTILTEQDRAVAEAADFRLAENLTTTLADHRYLAYIAFTRASQQLLITYPVTDEDGSSLVRSRFITELQSLFGELTEESIAGRARSLEEIKTKFDLAEVLAGQLGKDSPKDQPPTFSAQLLSLLKKIRNEPDLAEIGDVVASAINYDNSAKLQSRVVNELFGQQIKSSATGLQNFAQCPYKYFARYSLGLRERAEFKLRPLDLGEFYHRVLDRLVKKLIATGSDLAAAESKDLLKLLNEQIAEILTEETFIGSFGKRNLHNKFIIDSACEILEDFVLAVSELCRAGAFRPAFTEITFGQAGQDLGRYEIKLSDGRIALVRGKIDRLDIAEIDGEKIGLIFDYKKTTNKTFSWPEFFYGLDMQLAVYMLAAKNSGTKDLVDSIAGAFYLPIEPEIESATLTKLQADSNKFSNKAQGIFNGTCAQAIDGSNDAGYSRYYNFRTTADGEPYANYVTSGVLRHDDFQNFLKFSQRKITELAEEITSGKIDISPYRRGQQSPCGYCEYKPLCRFDWRINDYNHLARTDKRGILGQLREIYGRGE